jgi:hypothetical protein
MTPGPHELKAALQRLIDGNAGEADRDAVRTALNAGVLVTGERAVAIGGDASDVIITTGDQNIMFSFKDADAATVVAAISSIAPTRLHEVPRPPADFTGREDELKETGDGNAADFDCGQQLVHEQLVTLARHREGLIDGRVEIVLANVSFEDFRIYLNRPARLLAALLSPLCQCHLRVTLAVAFKQE